MVCITVGGVSVANAQNDSAHGIKFSGYVDAYYAHYSDSVGAGKFQKFGAISPISDNFGVNIAQLTANYNSKRIRATVTLQAGDLPRAAWSPVYNYIQEANAGVRLAKNLWVDAGFFKTHIGTESLLPKDNICSSVSIITFYEPWWQSGVRLTYTPSDKFTGALYVVNGYNQFVAINKKKAAGLALTYNISDRFSIGYYNLLSDDTPDSISISHWRLLNNVVINIDITKKLKLQAGVDYIVQEHSDISYIPGYTDYSTAFANSGIVTLRYQWFKKLAVYGRYEVLNDQMGIITSPNNYDANNPAFHIMGGTLGIEYKPTESSY
ncbi:MAG TPA: outer membrane beta-barrel protein, partial [Aquella sp.]|nr:outer membrane beta-barrel protein [Aquella sp.]